VCVCMCMGSSTPPAKHVTLMMQETGLCFIVLIHEDLNV